MHIILITSVFSGHLFYLTLMQCSLGRSHTTGVTNFTNINVQTKRKIFENIEHLAINLHITTLCDKVYQ